MRGFSPSPPCRLDVPGRCLRLSLEGPEAVNILLTLMLSVLACVLVCFLGFCSHLLQSGARRQKLLLNRSRESPPPAVEEQVEVHVPNSSNEDVPSYPQVPVLQQFLDGATEDPKRVALESPRQTVTYEALRCAAIHFSEFISPYISTERYLVALYIYGGPHLVAAVLGTWLAKGAWAPLDRKGPEKRLQTFVKQMNPVVVICDDDAPFTEVDIPLLRTDRMCFEIFEPSDLKIELSLEAVAQVIYTSGSTGTPKGVKFTHGRLAHSTHFFAEQCGINEDTKVLQKTPSIWSVFRHEVYPALCRKASVVYPNPQKSSDPMHLAEVIDSSSVSLLVITPSVLELVLDSGGLSSLQRIVCMGEPLSWCLSDRILKQLPEVQLMNFYGSTETENTTFTVQRSGMSPWRGSAVPAGVPQPHVAVHLLKPGSMVQSDEGEICFSGVMSSGYWEQPDLTAQSFVEHPELGLLYRTGDLGRWQNHQLQVLGRIDRQVKIRGCRVELQEVEVSLQPFVREVAVVAAKGGQEHLQIVAFVGPASIDVDTLKKDMQQHLLPHLMPSIFVAVKKLPRLPNGKVCLVSLKSMAADAFIKQSQETHETLDSLGILQHLTKSQLEEDKWLHNQQAFWTVVVMLQHFAIVQGAARVGPSEGPGDSGNLAFQVIQFLCHGRDMLAFIFLLGLIDARSEATFGPRDAAALMTTLIVTFLLNPTQDFLSDGIHTYPRMGSEWFLYVYLWSRLVLILLSCISPGWWQPCLVLFAACLVPDDVDWLQIPTPYRDLVANHTSVIWIKGFRWAFLFAPGMYLLSWHAIHAGFLETSKCLGRRIMSKASDHLSVYTNPEVAEQSLKVSFCLGCFAFYWAAALLSSIKTSDSNIYLTGMPSYRHGFQTLFVEGGFESTSHVSHSVSWEYMTHPSLLRYVLLWICEVLLFALPTLAIAAAFAYVPYHFKTMGTTCLGTYVIHTQLAGHEWIGLLTLPLPYITHQSLHPWLNCLIVLLYNVTVCVVFAHTIGAGFHRLLVFFLSKVARPSWPQVA